MYAEHVAGGADDVHPVPNALNDIALIQYTSGSTGTPKGVCLTHDNLVSNCEVLGRNMGHDPDRVGFSWLPPYHDMGLMGTIFVSMHQGVPLVLMSPMHFVQAPRRWLEAITDYKVTITVGPNFSLDMCADALSDDEATDLDLSTLQRLYCGAEPISVDTLARFEKIAAPLGFNTNALIPCYGMAETTLYVAGKSRDREVPHRLVNRAVRNAPPCRQLRRSRHRTRGAHRRSHHPRARGRWSNRRDLGVGAERCRWLSQSK